MDINVIINRINLKLAGENLALWDLEVHLDAVIDDINAALNSKFPAFSEFTATLYPSGNNSGHVYPNYTFFPEKYIRTVVIPGAAYKFYVTDEEGAFIAPSYQKEYQEGLFLMQRDYRHKVPPLYQDVAAEDESFSAFTAEVLEKLQTNQITEEQASALLASRARDESTITHIVNKDMFRL